MEELTKVKRRGKGKGGNEFRLIAILVHITKTSQNSIESLTNVNVQYLRETGKSKMKTHIEERMPMQYEECQAGLKFILRKAYEIVEDKSKKTQEQLTAMNLAVIIYGKLMDLSTNGVIFEQAVKWIEDRKKIQLTPEEEKQMEQILASEDNDNEEDASAEPEEE